MLLEFWGNGCQQGSTRISNFIVLRVSPFFCFVQLAKILKQQKRIATLGTVSTCTFSDGIFEIKLIQVLDVEIVYNGVVPRVNQKKHLGYIFGIYLVYG